MRSVHHTQSVAETEAIAADLAKTLPPGSVVTLTGDLGAGKTQFTRGLVIGLGGDGRLVSSPTYVLLNVYPTLTLTVYHLDAYRITGAADLEALGFDELLEEAGLIVVEWPQRAAGLLPANAVRVTIETTSEMERVIEIDRA